MAITIDGSHLTLSQVIEVARETVEVEIDPKALERTAKARAVLEDLLRTGRVVYGVNTGFGALANQKISTTELKQLQTNLVRSHSASVGKPHPPEVVRAMMLLRANTLLKGYSGIRQEIPELIIRLLNRKIHPYIPEKGSVGASGDLSPLSHMALVLVGEGKAESSGRWVDGGTALKNAGENPLVLEAKEGLALNNGTQQMLGIGCLALHDAYVLMSTCEASLALSLEAMTGWIDAFDSRIHELRPYLGQKAVATHVSSLLKGSRLIRSILGTDPEGGRPQDPYSFRCAPQVMGTVRDALEYVKTILEIEMNSATDNPLVFPEEAVILSGGNFHGQPVSMAMDILALAVSTLANISERRISALLDPSLNNGLPPFLVGKGSKPGLSSGLMAVQYTATALVAESKTMTHPASSDSIPTSGNFEDFVSMGPGAAQKAARIVENTQYVVGMELLVAAQGIDLRGAKGLGEGTERVYRLIRRHITPVTDDRSSHEDSEAVRRLIQEGRFAEIVKEEAKQTSV